MEQCVLCQRMIPKKLLTEHHLVPLLKGGKETVPMHNICHGKIHSLFSESELANKYDTIGKLMENDEIKSFVSWIRKKPDSFTDSNKLHTRRRR